VLAQTLVDLHVHDRGSVCFPRASAVGTLVSERTANLPPATWRALRDHFGLAGERNSTEAHAFTGRLFRVVLALLHSPDFQADHRDALRYDWAHISIPKDRALFEEFVSLGDQIALLLDPAMDADGIVERILGASRVRSLGVLRSTAVDPDLRVSIAYFGAAKGRWTERAYRPEEEPHLAWGATTGDPFINETTCFANVPEHVVRHELGGYEVLKKWLGYRQAKARGGEPLSLSEVSHVRSMIQRLAALLALGSSLDAACERAATDAFTADDLGLT